MSTSGPDPDPDGYLVTLDGSGSALPLPVNGSTSFPNVAAGEHTVALSGLVSNCTADAASQSVTVVAGATATVSFTVSCSAIPSVVGSIRVVTSTIGSNPDADGYQFAIDDGPAQAIPTTSTATVNDVAPGAHRVVLSGVAANCGLPDGRSKVVTVIAGQMADAVFTVTCYEMGPSASQSSVQVDPASITIGFPGQIHLAMSTITVTVLDANGTPLQGMEVTVNATGSGNTIRPWPSAEMATTNVNGVATFAFSSTMPEPKTITALVNGIPLDDSPVITVVKSQTSVFIRSFDPEPSTAGEPFVVTVSIAGERGMRPEAGTVSVRSNLEPEAGCDAAPVSPVGETLSEATCEMTLSVVSTHMLTATYSGDSQFEGNTSTAAEHVVIAP
ncbi:MAG: Ig-like domain-containing protein [Gemmatimonadota bacterium]|nr:Ig-like domain-containing protein [Gemmatimonadota bacterium]